MKLKGWSIALVLALGGPARADLKPSDQEKKAPDEQGSGGGQEQQKEKNPLPEIVEKMKAVEKRLAEADTGSWTQEEQKRIADALDLEAGAVDALTKLIEEIENRPP